MFNINSINSAAVKVTTYKIIRIAKVETVVTTTRFDISDDNLSKSPLNYDSITQLKAFPKINEPNSQKMITNKDIWVEELYTFEGPF